MIKIVELQENFGTELPANNEVERWHAAQWFTSQVYGHRVSIWGGMGTFKL